MRLAQIKNEKVVQALRDIPTTFKTPEEVVWPEVPNK